jgi:hypothetical protein
MIPESNQAVDAIFSKGADPKNAILQDGIAKLRMPRSYTIIGIIGILLFLPYPIQAVIAEEQHLFWYLMTVGMFLVFGIPGTICLLYGINHEVTITKDFFRVTSPLGTKRTIVWGAVATGRFSSLERAVILTTGSGHRFRVAVYLRGAKLFWSTLNKKTGIPVGDWGLPYNY